MFKKLVMTSIATMVLSQAQASEYDNFFQQDDKQMHMGMSVPFGMFGAALCQKEFGLVDDVQIFLCGMALGMIPGLAKEAYDQRKYGGWSNADLTADAIGSAVGSFGTVVIYRFSSGD